MNNEVPGVSVPDAVLERMRRADTKDRARIEGVAIACEALQALLPHIQGAQISAPFGRYQTALDVTQVIPRERLTSFMIPPGPEFPAV
jgi:homocysteine S-methyltransferase